MAEERIDIVVAQKGATEVKRDLDQIGNAAKAAIPDLNSMRSAIDRIQAAAAATAGPTSRLQSAMGSLNSATTQITGTFGQFGTVTGTATAGFNGLAAAATQTVSPLSNVSNGLNQTATAAGKAKVAAKEATIGFQGLWRILLAFAIIQQISQAVANSADQWTLLGNKLRQVSTDSANLVASQEAVYASAQLTRSGMEEIGTLYTRTSMATKALGLSQREVMNLTEEVAMAMKLSGATVQEGASAMRQLSQAFNKGKLDGDEFKSIMENAPRLQRAFAEGLGVTTGKLMEMSEAGELTLPKLIAALQKAGSSIRTEFGSSLPTIAEGFQYLGNSATRFIGQLNEASGASQAFYNAMKFLGDNINVVAFALGVLATAIVVAFGPAAVAMVSTFGVMFWTAIGGPIGLVISLLAVAVAAVYAFGDSWKVTADGVSVLDYIRAALQITIEYVQIAAKWIGEKFQQAWTWVSETWSQLTTFFSGQLQNVMALVSPWVETVKNHFQGAWNTVTAVWGVFSSFFGTLLSEVGSTMQSAVGTYIGLWRGLYLAIVELFSALPAAFIAIFTLAMNGAADVIQRGLAGITNAINTVLNAVGITPIPPPDLSGWKGAVDAGALDVGSKVAAGFNRGMGEGRAAVDGLVTSVGDAGEQLGAEARRIAGAAGDAGQDVLDTFRQVVPGVEAAAGRLTDRARQISEERRRLEAARAPGQLSTTRGPNTFKATADDADGASGAVDKLQNKLNSLLRTIDPITGAQERLRQGTETLNKAYDAGLITLDRRNELLARLNEHLRDQLDPLGKINRDMDQEARLLRLGNEERAIQRQLLQDIEKLRRAGVTLSPIEAQQLENSIRAMENLKEQSKLLGDVLNRVFKGAEDAFVQFIETGKVDFKKLISSMISDIARLAFQSFVTKPAANALQGVLGSLFGGGSGGSGGSGGWFSNLFSGFFGGGNTAAAAVPTFGGLYATGGSFTVGGSGGVDSQMVNFRASPGERVNIERPGQGGNGNGGQNIVFNIQTQDANSFRASEGQIAARMARIAGRGNRNL